MNRADAEEFTQTVEQIGAGWWRQIAWADRQGIPEALGLSTRDWVEQRIGGYVRLSIPERREAVAELAAEGMTQREVAAVLGVGAGTVNEDLRVQNRTDDADEQDVPAEPVQNRTVPPSPEEVERAQRERDRRDAVARQVNRIRNLLNGWETVSHLQANPLRADVLNELDDVERKRVLTIEEVIHA